MDMYAENILEHYKNPQNKGAMDDADIIQTAVNPLCGDHLALYIKHDGQKIKGISFEGSGCAISQAAMSMLTEKAMGMDLNDAAKISKKDILKMLGVPIGPARMKCALLGWESLGEALKNRSNDQILNP